MFSPKNMFLTKTSFTKNLFSQKKRFHKKKSSQKKMFLKTIRFSQQNKKKIFQYKLTKNIFTKNTFSPKSPTYTKKYKSFTRRPKVLKTCLFIRVDVNVGDVQMLELYIWVVVNLRVV